MNKEPKSSPVLIREAKADEMQVVRELFREYARSLELDLAFQDFDAELATLPGKYARPWGRLLLAVVGHEVVGCVALRPFDEGRCEMKRLYVRPTHRGMRIGEALIERFLDEARGIGKGGELDTASGQRAGDAQSSLGSARDLASGVPSGSPPESRSHYQRVVLDTISPLMSGAIAMYKKMGFREIPPYRPNPMRGALYMELKL